jgi:hypothetical protein
MIRIRTIHTDGGISVRDLAFSQEVETLKGLTKAERDGFYAKKETKLPDGRSVYLVRDGV